MNSEVEIELLIRGAFPITPNVGDNIICHECDECFELYDNFKDKAWDSISDETLNYHYNSLPLLSDETKQYYYPAYLIYSLRHPKSSITEFLLYTLSSNHRHQPTGGFTQSQVTAILKYLDYIRERGDEILTEEITTANDYWRDQLSRGSKLGTDSDGS
jgi:hypothetical protein